MSLEAGTKLGPYEIQSPVGAGGMGEVYRARDTRLGRDVALKVLPEEFAHDAERMARLRREAQVLASLNHPNIAAIYGFEDSGNVHALVMELVEGPTLAERIKQGAIPIDEALPMAKQIAEGLEYAHERGIIHRDLKPSNVKVTPEGQVKVLDFGLAKAIEGDPSTTSMENSPTLSAMATHAGFLLGTAAYMSPEQARGKRADRRADIWAFGVVLFEMLSGQRLFTGETTSDTLAAVIRAEPDWNELPAATPPKIRELLHRCLKKDPRQRLQSIGDARIAIEEVLSGAPRDASSSSAVSAPQIPTPAWRRALPWMLAAAASIVAALFVFGYIARAPQPAQAVVAQIAPPANAASGLPVPSPDGKQLAFAAQGSDGKQLLWVRSLDSSVWRPLAHTENAANPFWSADGRSIGYFADGKLDRIDATGGPPITLASVSGSGGTWSQNGTILISSAGERILRVQASGGGTEQVMKLNSAQIPSGWPQFLPDGNHFLFYQQSNAGAPGTYAGSLDGGAPRLVLAGSSVAVYAQEGYLLFVRDQTLMAQPFDARKLQLTGGAMPLAENVGVNKTFGRASFGISQNGVLVYGNAAAAAGQILWYDRSGKQLAETGAPGHFGTPSISPDGDKLAVSRTDQTTGRPDIWIYDLTRGIRTRVTFASGDNVAAFWSPDERHVCFTSNRSGRFHLYEKSADGTGSAVALVGDDDAAEFFGSWSADGRYLAFQRSPSAGFPGPGNGEIWAIPFFGDRKRFPVVRNGQFVAIHPALSPDAKWLAYVSNESGRLEVYVVPFPHGGGKWQVSVSGGKSPRWRRDGRGLFYRALDNKIMSVAIAEQAGKLAIGKVQALFQADPAPGGLGPMYDVSADGKKFVVVSESSQAGSRPVTLVVNWPALLKKQ